MYPHANLSAAGSKSGDDEASAEASAEASLMSCLQVADEFYSKVQSPATLKHFQAMQEKSADKSVDKTGEKAIHQVTAL